MNSESDKITLDNLKYPKSYEHNLSHANDDLNNHLRFHEETYEGTDPVPDAKKLYIRTFRNYLKHEDDTFHWKDVCSLKGYKVIDPYEVFGHGVTSFFSTVRSLMLIMLIMTILFIPVMIIYN